MTDEHPMMAGSATVFVVSDIATSLAYYRDVLGFQVTFEYGAAAVLCLPLPRRGRPASARGGGTKRLPGHGAICIFVRDVDQIYAELSGRGARLLNRPEDRDYGMRDFDVVDADGNQLTFGMGTDAAA